jgi:hypothetical protein
MRIRIRSFENPAKISSSLDALQTENAILVGPPSSVKAVREKIR